MPPKATAPKDKIAGVRFTVAQQDAMVAWVEIPENYPLLYEHGKTKGVSNEKAFRKMAEDLKKRFSEEPQLRGNFDESNMSWMSVQKRWKYMVEKHRSNRPGRRPTGDGVLNPNETLIEKDAREAPYRSRLEALLREKPTYRPLVTRNSGSQDISKGKNLAPRQLYHLQEQGEEEDDEEPLIRSSARRTMGENGQPNASSPSNTFDFDDPPETFSDWPEEANDNGEVMSQVTELINVDALPTRVRRTDDNGEATLDISSSQGADLSNVDAQPTRMKRIPRRGDSLQGSDITLAAASTIRSSGLSEVLTNLSATKMSNEKRYWEEVEFSRKTRLRALDQQERREQAQYQLLSTFLEQHKESMERQSEVLSKQNEMLAKQTEVIDTLVKAMKKSD